MALAPIALFAYKRPEHTLKVLEALSRNDLAEQSLLYIFCDGPREDATTADKKAIERVRAIAQSRQWCGEMRFVFSPSNKGLADSIVDGVSEVVQRHEKLIVLEDDIITSPGFLRYMNDALQVYEQDERVMHISAYMFPVDGSLPSSFFYNTASCWGWGTWERAWKHFNPDAAALLKNIIDSGRLGEFTLDGTADFLTQLEGNISGRVKTWAVKWYASFFLSGGHALHPYPSLTQNIGHDGSGENCNNNNGKYSWAKLAESIPVQPIEISESALARNLMKRFYQNRGSRQAETTKAFDLKGMLPSPLRRALRNLWQSAGKGSNGPKNPYLFLKRVPRFRETGIQLLGRKIKIADSASFLSMYREIFEREIYRFDSPREAPYIIDGGSNIGLSIIYFKQLFPDAEVVGFEPDPRIFSILEHNLNAFGLNDVRLYQKGIWKGEEMVPFFSEGADGGRITAEPGQVTRIPTTRLRDFLDREVDFLKLDIEGAETEVLEDCRDLLKRVRNLFVEYHSFADRDQKLDEILKILRANGFRYYIHNNDHRSRQPFLERKQYLNIDNQLNIYAVRQPGNDQVS